MIFKLKDNVQLMNNHLQFHKHFQTHVFKVKRNFGLILRKYLYLHFKNNFKKIHVFTFRILNQNLIRGNITCLPQIFIFICLSTIMDGNVPPQNSYIETLICLL